LAAIGNQTMTNHQGALSVPLNATDPDPGDSVFFTAQAGHQGFVVKSQYGLFATDPSSTNFLGLGEKWLKGRVNPFGQPWYFILTTGELYAWNGQAGFGAIVPAALLVTLDPV